MLEIEKLEDKNLMAVNVFIGAFDGSLNIVGDNAANDVELYQTAPGQSTNVYSNGNLLGTVILPVTKVIADLGNGDDNFTNNTFLDSVVHGGNGNDTLQGGGGNDQMFGDNGNDVITNFVTDSNYNPIGAFTNDVLDGGNGNDSLWGGWGSSDKLLGGNGNDDIYDIVGGSNYIDGGAGNDWTISRTGVGLPTNPISGGGLIADTLVPDSSDFNVVQFDAGTQANGPVVIDGTLYVLNLGSGSVIVDQTFDRSGGQLLVNYNGVASTVPAAGIHTIAGIGGATSDTFINNTKVSSVFYGQGGDDTLLGGSNDDVLKGGNGNDYLNGRQGNDDITGDAGTDILLADSRYDIVRADYDPVNKVYLDQVFSVFGTRIVQKKIRF